MNTITLALGQNIRFYRKQHHMTQGELGILINKGKATVAKYESGQIIMDVQTLYEIAKALHVTMDQLLFMEEDLQETNQESPHPLAVPNFFKDVHRLFFYFYDGRNKSLNQSLLVIDSLPRQEGSFGTWLYYNIESMDRYHLCEYRYRGQLIHYDVISIFNLQNTSMAMEELKIIIPANYNHDQEKFAYFSGLSSRPLMPVTFKILVSKTQKEKSSSLVKRLKLNKCDIQMLKFYNMFTVT